ERVEVQRRAQDRGGHRDVQLAVQIVALALETLVLALVDLDVQVTSRTTGGTHLTLAVEADPHAVLDPGGNLHRQGAAPAHPALAAALAARARNDRAEAAAARAGARGHHLA